MSLIELLAGRPAPARFAKIVTCVLRRHGVQSPADSIPKSCALRSATRPTATGSSSGTPTSNTWRRRACSGGRCRTACSPRCLRPRMCPGHSTPSSPCCTGWTARACFALPSGPPAHAAHAARRSPRHPAGPGRRRPYQRPHRDNVSVGQLAGAMRAGGYCGSRSGAGTARRLWTGAQRLGPMRVSACRSRRSPAAGRTSLRRRRCQGAAATAWRSRRACRCR